MREALEYGIKMEDDAIAFYTRLIDKVTNPGSKQFLRELAIYKKNHKKIFEEALRNPEELIAMCSLPADLRDYKVTENLREFDLSRDSTYQELLIFAIRVEQSSHDFYMFMAKQFKAQDIGEIFACFAREDLEHKLLLEKEYDSVILAEN